MEGEGRFEGGQGRQTPRFVWDIKPVELRNLYLRGNGDAATARSIGFSLAAVAALGVAALAGYSLGQGDAAGGAFRFAEGLAFLVLGCLVQGGKGWASLGLMILYTVEMAVHLIGHMHGSMYFPDRFGLWPMVSLLAWAMWMRVSYVAFRAERRQAASPVGPDALAVVGS